MEWLYESVAYRGNSVLHLDILAFAWFALAWFGYARFADRHYGTRKNLIRIMDDMRSRWMHQMLKRDTRIADATLIGNIMRTISFFASTTILILMGIITVMGAHDSGISMVQTIPFTMGNTPLMWELKLALLALIFVYAFFKLTWSVRQYNYVSIVVGAAPMPHEHPEQHFEFADRAGKLIGNAGRHFNFGLRAYYFGLAVVSWFLNGFIFMAVTTLIVYVVYRREFRSHTVNNLIALDHN